MPSVAPSTLSGNANERDIQRRSFRGEKSSKSKSLDYFITKWKPQLEEHSGDLLQVKDIKKQEKATILSHLNQCAGVVAHTLRETIKGDQHLNDGCRWSVLPASLKNQHVILLENMLKDQIPIDRCVDNWCAWLLLRESYANFRKRNRNESVCNYIKCIVPN